MNKGNLLEEIVMFEGDFPVRFRMVHIENYPLHYHVDLEIMYVLRGRITIKSTNYIYRLSERSVFVSNKNEVHGVYDASEDNVVIVIYLESKSFAKYFPGMDMAGGTCFRTVGKDVDNPKLIRIQKDLIYSAGLYLAKFDGYKEKIIEIMKNLLFYLDENFNYWTYAKTEGKELYWEEKSLVEKERLRDIIRYVYANRYKKISLDDLSYELSLDSYYLSHMINEMLGITFRDLLMFARVEGADQMLLATDMSVNEIRKKTSISTMDYFNKHFDKWYHCTPQEYREKYKEHTIGKKRIKLEYVTELETFELIKKIAEDISLILPDIKRTKDMKDSEMNISGIYQVYGIEFDSESGDKIDTKIINEEGINELMLLVNDTPVVKIRYNKLNEK